jgi:small neutral amino acid transporter SnatA (MarC family)
MAYLPAELPDPGTTATTILSNGGEELVGVLTVVAPAIVAIGAIFWAVRTVMRKLGMGGKVAKVG